MRSRFRAALVHAGIFVMASVAEADCPGVLLASPPRYPEVGAAAGITGTVAADVVIDECGTVLGVEEVVGPLLLRESARAAALRWSFSPTGAQERRTLFFTFESLPPLPCFQYDVASIAPTFLCPDSIAVFARTILICDPVVTSIVLDSNEWPTSSSFDPEFTGTGMRMSAEAASRIPLR